MKLGVAYLLQGNRAAAKSQFERVLQLRPLPSAHWHLAELAIQGKDAEVAIGHYEQALAIEPSLINKANNLAWLLSTSDVERLRDGSRAVEVAEQFCRAQEEQTAMNLDTLAAAYAAADRYDDAITAAARALQLAERDNNRRLAEAIRRRLELYRQKTPFRESLK